MRPPSSGAIGNRLNTASTTLTTVSKLPARAYKTRTATDQIGPELPSHPGQVLGFTPFLGALVHRERGSRHMGDPRVARSSLNHEYGDLDGPGGCWMALRHLVSPP
jgi:hypothetical protein